MLILHTWVLLFLLLAAFLGVVFITLLRRLITLIIMGVYRPRTTLCLVINKRVKKVLRDHTNAFVSFLF